MLTLPDILTEEEYKDTWEWDGWKPKAKPDAPEEIKEAINEWIEEVEDDLDEDDDIIIDM